MGVIHRATRDFDILVPELPPSIAAAARGFARAQREVGNELWPAHVRATVAELGRRLGHGV